MVRLKTFLEITSLEQSWQDVNPPVGWTWSLPFTVQRKGRRFRVNPGWTIEQNAPAGKIYYVSTTGSESNDGLTPETPFRRIYTAINKPDVDEIHVAAGVYGWTNGWVAQLGTRSYSIYAIGGRVICGSFAEGLTWTLDTPTNPHTYKATRTYVGKCADAKYKDNNGDYPFLTQRASAAEVEANPGSWYTDGSMVWVRLSDSRVPDINLRCFFSNTNILAAFTGNRTLYVEGFDFEGGNGFSFRLYADAGPLVPTGYFKNCTFKYSDQSSLQVQGGIAYLQGCLYARAYDDGLSGKIFNAAIPYICEIACQGRHNGAVGDIDNGSSCHDGGSVIRIMGEYHQNVGRNLHDVGAGTKSWNLGLYVHDSASEVNDSNIAIGTGGTGGTMWLDRCNSYGSTTDMEEDTGAILYKRQCNTKGVFVGSPEEY